MYIDHPDAEDFFLYAENADALDVFIACGTQWRLSQMNGSVLGLDYQGLAAVIDFMKISDRRAMFFDISIMERAFVNEINHA